MQTVLLIIQILLAIILIGVILVQSRGTGFSRAWGGSHSFTRRGLERIVFRATFVLSALFILISLLQIIL